MIKDKDLVSATGAWECHVIISVERPGLPFSDQLREIEHEFQAYLRDRGDGMTPVFMRWFLSDAANQAQSISKDFNCAMSIVEQPPLDLTKVALWVWLMEDVEVSSLPDGSYSVRHGEYTHLFEGSRCRPGEDSHCATYDMLAATQKMLNEKGGSLIGNCVRTWFFVQNVDVNYGGVVSGRNSLFNECGLTRNTRFIASTGIGGRHADKTATVQMDSYSVIGLHEGQMKMINAPDYLNPTYEYGVAFERATSVDYGDRRHLFISGTASIDNRGEIVWEGDIRHQTLRMLTNVEALLKAAECGWDDVGQMLVYLRDMADAGIVRKMFEERFPDIPYLILLALVCRPGWLIEMECMAMKPVSTEWAAL